jgi:hypothetical protein
MHSQGDNQRITLTDIIIIFLHLRDYWWAVHRRRGVPLAPRVSLQKLKFVISRAVNGDHCVTVNIKIVGMRLLVCKSQITDATVSKL